MGNTSHPMSGDRPGSGPRILDIPAEILLKIFKNLEVYTGFEDGANRSRASVGDIKNCRLTCRRFNHLSSELLVPTLTINFSFASLDRLEQIAKHATISRGVRTVRVRLDEYSEALADGIRSFAYSSVAMLQEAEKLIKNEIAAAAAGRFQISSKEPSRLQEVARMASAWNRIFVGCFSLPDTYPGDTFYQRLLTKAHQEYQTLFLIQQTLLEDLGGDNGNAHGGGRAASFLSDMATALAKLPCFRNLEFTDLTTPTQTTETICQRVLTDTSTDVNTIVYQEILLPASSFPGRGSRSPLPCWALGRMIPQLLASLSDARQLDPDSHARLEVLKIHTADITLDYLAMSPMIRHKISTELGHLKSFSFVAEVPSILRGVEARLRGPVDIRAIFGSDYEEISNQSRVLNSEILNDWLKIPLASPALERFDLTLPLLVGGNPSAVVDIGPALMSRTIPFTKDLRVFNVTGVAFSEENLATFLETTLPGSQPAHSTSSVPQSWSSEEQSTARFDLDDIILLSGSWETLDDALRSAHRRNPNVRFSINQP